MIVVDASAVLEVLLRTDCGGRVEARWRAAHGGLNAPHLIDAEVLNALRRLTFAAAVAPDRVARALNRFDDLRLRRWSTVPLRTRIWALRANVSAYDASYVALAERLGCPLVTCDARLARSSGHDGPIELFEG